MKNIEDTRGDARQTRYQEGEGFLQSGREPVVVVSVVLPPL